MELRDGQILIGKVEKIKIELIEFRENDTGLIYETAKKEIRYIQLSSGKILTFEDYYQPVKREETQPTQQPVVVEKGNGASIVLLLLGLAGVVLVFLAIIGSL